MAVRVWAGDRLLPIAVAIFVGFCMSACSAYLNNPPLDTVTQTSIVGTQTVADGSTPSTITISLVDDGGYALVGATPTFEATDTGGTNVYGPCSPTNDSGISTCTLKSRRSEEKTLRITSPVDFLGSTVIFDPGPEDTIVLVSSLPSVAIAGEAFSTQPVFEIRDSEGNLVETSSQSVTLAAFTDPDCTVAGAGTLSATTNPVTSAAGVVSFSGVNYTKAGPLYLKASASAFSTCTPMITVKHNTANKLAFSTQPPNSAVAGELYGVDPVVQVQDAWGNYVNTGPTATQTITLDAWRNDACTVVVDGVLSVSLNPVVSVAGVATFTGISHTRATGIRLRATAPGLSSACSERTGVIPNVPDSGTSNISGTGPVAANSYHYSAVTINISDVYGNPRQGDSVTFSATDTGGSNAYEACTLTDSAGNATCRLRSSAVELKTLTVASPVVKVGGTVNFIIPPVSANSSISGTGPVVANGVATSTITVVLRDASNFPVVGIAPQFSATDTGSTNSYGTCSASNASGVSTCTMTSTKAEVKTLTLDQPLLLTGGTITFVHGPANYLAFTTTPGSGTAGVNFSAQPVVRILDQFGNHVNTGADAAKIITLAPFTNSGCSTPGAGTLGADVNPLTASAGVAGFSGVSYTKSGTLYLRATATGVTQACSGGISVTHNVSHHLTFSTQPGSTGTAGSNLSQQPVVQIRDVYDNVVTTGAGASTSVSLSAVQSDCSTAGSGTLNAAQNPLSASSGSAGFSGVNYTGVGAIKLKANASGLTGVCSSSITFSPGPAVNSTITGTGPVTADGVASSALSITLEDAYGNFHVGVTPTFSATNTGGANTYGACTVSNASGSSSCTLRSTKAETKTLQLLTPYSKSGGTVQFVAGPPSKLAYVVQPSSTAVAGANLGQSPAVQVQDQHGNPVNSATHSITLTAYSNSGCGTVGGGTLTATTNPLSANGVDGRANFSSVSYTRSGPLYLGASSGGLTGACSNSITVSAAAASSGNSSISGTTPVTADGSSTSIVSVVLKDTYGNPLQGTVPVFTATGSNNTIVSCSSVDSAGNSTCGLRSTRAQDKTLSLTSPIALAGNVVTFVAGPAAQLAFSVQPSSSTVAGSTFGQSPSVQVRDANGNPINSATHSITLSPRSDSNCLTADGGVLSAAANPVAANGTSGTAAFSSLSYTKSGPLYLKAEAGALTGCSSVVNVSAAAAHHLEFSVQPSSTGLAAKSLAVQPSVSVMDTYGNLVTSASHSVQISPFTNSSCSVAAAGTLGASLNPLAASGGTAAFSAVSYTLEETIYLGASAAGVTAACSSAVAVHRWKPLSAPGAPGARKGHAAVWTGSTMLLWGGRDAGGYLNSGYVYDPVGDSWAAIPLGVGHPSGREGHTAVWTGSEMIIWGGTDGGQGLNSGSRYHPVSQIWNALPASPGAPSPRYGHTAIWTGTQMVIFGGTDGAAYFNTGGVYTATTDSWSGLQASGAPAPRSRHTALWSGSEMLVFGGYSGSGYLNSGGHYVPAGTGSWSGMSLVNAPTARASHSSVWTGSEMWIWGGEDGSSRLDTGGRYDPVSGGTWGPITTVGAPSARSLHTAIWTGTSMIVWGGNSGGPQLATGGVLGPSGTWTATSTGTNLPEERDSHTAVWASDRMLIFGGCSSGACSTFEGTGALYVP